MRFPQFACLSGAALVACALFRYSGGQQLPPQASLPVSSFVHCPSFEVGGPRLIPGFDMNTLPVGKIIGKPVTDQRIADALDQSATFTLKDATLQAFADQIAEKHKINVSINTPALTADGKGTETILNLRVANVSLRSALRLALDEQGLTFVVRHESLQITTKVAAEIMISTRIYQVQDLVVLPNDPAGRPDFESLIELLTSTLMPESWREAGGTVGEVKAFSGPGAMVLVVTQTDAGHEEVEKLLTDLRAAQLPAVYDLQQHRMRTGRDSAYPSNFGLGGALMPAPSASGS